jgi:putative hydrolase of the HAD superfamily
MNIVFDFGAVLFDWRPAQVVRDHFPDQISTDEQAASFAGAIFNHPDWHAFDAGLVSTAQILASTLSRVSLPSEGLARMIETSIPERLSPIDSSIRVLDALRAQRDAGRTARRLKLFFLSNMPEPYARVLVRKHDFIDWFDDGVFSGDVKLAKPDPAIYAHCDAQFALQGDKGDTLFIDDHPANIAAAKVHGWQTIHLTDPSQLDRLISEQISLSALIE